MPFVSRVRVTWTGTVGMPGFSNIHFSGAGAVQPMIDAVRDAITIGQSSISSAVTATVDPVVTLIDDASGDVTGTTTGTQRVVVGTGVGDMLPLATQGLVGFRTGSYVLGRELRGRWYIPGILETLNTAAGVPSSTVTLTLINMGNTLLNAAPELVVYSRTKSLSAAVSACYSPTKWAVLRSRRD